jgi:hypothetical protein
MENDEIIAMIDTLPEDIVIRVRTTGRDRRVMTDLFGNKFESFIFSNAFKCFA